jgi:hypothetical protein
MYYLTEPLLYLHDYVIAHVHPWSRVLPETDPQLAKKFPVFNGGRKFITAFKTARHLCLSWARLIQSVPSSHFSRVLFNSILHLRLGLSSVLLPSGFPTTTLYAHLCPTRVTCPPQLSLLDLIIRIYLVRSTQHKAPCYVVFPIPLLPRLS